MSLGSVRAVGASVSPACLSGIALALRVASRRRLICGPSSEHYPGGPTAAFARSRGMGSWSWCYPSLHPFYQALWVDTEFKNNKDWFINNDRHSGRLVQVARLSKTLRRVDRTTRGA